MAKKKAAKKAEKRVTKSDFLRKALGRNPGLELDQPGGRRPAVVTARDQRVEGQPHGSQEETQPGQDEERGQPPISSRTEGSLAAVPAIRRRREPGRGVERASSVPATMTPPPIQIQSTIGLTRSVTSTAPDPGWYDSRIA